VQKLLKNINELKINSIIILDDKQNFSNHRKFFVGNHSELLEKKFLRTSKILFLSSYNLFSRIWETVSGRLIRNLVFYHDFPKKVFLTIDFDFLVILTKKSILIYILRILIILVIIIYLFFQNAGQIVKY
jgi:hypothetical protein